MKSAPHVGMVSLMRSLTLMRLPEYAAEINRLAAERRYVRPGETYYPDPSVWEDCLADGMSPAQALDTDRAMGAAIGGY